MIQQGRDFLDLAFTWRTTFGCCLYRMTQHLSTRLDANSCLPKHESAGVAKDMRCDRFFYLPPSPSLRDHVLYCSDRKPLTWFSPQPNEEWRIFPKIIIEFLV